MQVMQLDDIINTLIDTVDTVCFDWNETIPEYNVVYDENGDIHIHFEYSYSEYAAYFQPIIFHQRFVTLVTKLLQNEINIIDIDPGYEYAFRMKKSPYSEQNKLLLLERLQKTRLHDLLEYRVSDMINNMVDNRPTIYIHMEYNVRYI
jgi:hypothetical protein